MNGHVSGGGGVVCVGGVRVCSLWQYQLLLHTQSEHSHPLFCTKGASYHGNAVFGLMYGWTWNSKRERVGF